MQRSEPLIPARLIGLLNDYLATRKAEPAPLIRLSVIAQREGEEFISLLQWLRVLHRIMEETGNPAVGLEIGAQIRPRHLGVAGYLLAHCANAGEALVRMLHFRELVIYGAEAELSIEGEYGILKWSDERAPLNQLWADVRSSAAAAFCRQITGLHDYPVARTTYPLSAPADVSPYERFYGGEVQFGGTACSMAFGLDLLSTPLLEPEPSLVEALDEKAHNLLSSLSRQGEIDETLYQATMHAINIGNPSADAVAEQLNCSRRTLLRRLSRHGKTFQLVRDECRLELARSYLSDPQLRMADIAGLLGYTEQAAFSRAFKRWTGQTPGQFRRGATG